MYILNTGTVDRRSLKLILLSRSKKQKKNKQIYGGRMLVVEAYAIIR